MAVVDYHWGKAVAGIGMLALLTILPWVGLLAGDVWVRGLSAASALIQVMGYLLANPPAPWRGVIVYPVAAALLVYSMARAVVLTAAHRGIWWGDRFFSLAELKREAVPHRAERPSERA